MKSQMTLGPYLLASFLVVGLPACGGGGGGGGGSVTTPVVLPEPEVTVSVQLEDAPIVNAIVVDATGTQALEGATPGTYAFESGYSPTLPLDTRSQNFVDNGRVYVTFDDNGLPFTYNDSENAGDDAVYNAEIDGEVIGPLTYTDNDENGEYSASVDSPYNASLTIDYSADASGTTSDVIQANPVTALIPSGWDGEEEIAGLPAEVLDSAVSDGVSGASDALSSIDTDGDGVNESIAEIVQKTAAAITTVQETLISNGVSPDATGDIVNAIADTGETVVSTEDDTDGEASGLAEAVGAATETVVAEAQANGTAEELFVASTDETGEEQPVDIAAATENLVVAAKVIAEVTEVAVEQVDDASFAEAINSVVKEALPDTLEETTQVSVTEIAEEVATSVEGAEAAQQAAADVVESGGEEVFIQSLNILPVYYADTKRAASSGLIDGLSLTEIGVVEGFTLALSGTGPNKVITVDVDDALASSIDQLALNYDINQEIYSATFDGDNAIIINLNAQYGTRLIGICLGYDGATQLCSGNVTSENTSGIVYYALATSDQICSYLHDASDETSSFALTSSPVYKAGSSSQLDDINSMNLADLSCSS